MHTKFNDTAFIFLVYTIVTIAVLACLYPFVYVFSMSISAIDEIDAGRVWLFPRGFSLDAYRVVVATNEIWLAYWNTILYSVVGTVITLIFTVIAAYPLTRKDFSLRKPYLILLMIPMFISGGLIPSFILISSLGMYNTMWAIVLPGAITTWYVILVKTFMQYNVPDSILESARIDGANDIIILFKMVVPLMTPILAVIALYSMVGFWNSYLNILIYLRDASKHTIQIFLMNVLLKDSEIMLTRLSSRLRDTGDIGSELPNMQLKYAFVMFVSLPIIFSYPFLQKFFIKGVIVGSLKD